MDELIICSFCQNSTESLIEINGSAVEFNDIIIEFNDLVTEIFNKKIRNQETAVICESCKDQLVQFYIFYLNIKNNQQNFIEDHNLAKCKKYLQETDENVDCIKFSGCLMLVPDSERKNLESKLQFDNFLDSEEEYRIDDDDDSMLDSKINEEIIAEHEGDEIEIKVIDDVDIACMNRQFIEYKNQPKEVFLDITEQEVEDRLEDMKVVHSCIKCGFKSTNKEEYKQHMTTHISSKRFNKLFCSRCSYQFTTQAHFNAHINGHKLFDTLAKHMNYPKCESCGMMFVDDQSLELHLTNHDEVVPIESTGFFLKFGLRQEAEKDENYELNDDSPKCGHCFEECINDEELVKHLLIFHAKQLICPIDLRNFSNNQAFTIHMRNNHPELFPNASFICSVCRKEFDTLYEKLSHMKVCKEKAFNCLHCQKSFSKKCHLVKHLKLVSGELNITCEICNKVCRDKHDYKIHSQSHSTEKLFNCSLCSKSYKTSSARAVHLQSHFETILCRYCNLQFKSRRTMQKHVKNKHEK